MLNQVVDTSGFVSASGDYQDPAWLASLSAAKITGTFALAQVSGLTQALGLLSNEINDLLSGYTACAPLNSPALTGTPTAPTPATSDNSNAIATTGFVKAQGYGTGSGAASAAGSAGQVQYAGAGGAFAGAAGLTYVPSSNTLTLPGGASIGPFLGGSWLDMPTSGPSAIGSGGAGVNPWIAFCQQGNFFTDALANDIAIKNGDGRLILGNGSQAGPSTLRIASDQVTIAAHSSGYVPLSIQGAPGQAGDLVDWKDSSGNVLSAVRADGSLALAQLADAAAQPNSLYFSTNQGKAVFKDPGGNPNPLY